MTALAADLRSTLAALPHSGLVRLDHGFPGFDGVAWMKTVSPSELTAHRLAQRAVPDGVPTILASWPVEGRPATWVMITADGGIDGVATESAARSLADGLVVLAQIHTELTGDPALAELPDALDRSTTEPPDQASGGMDLLRRRCRQWDLGLSRAELSSWAAGIDRLPQWRTTLLSDTDRTLVHGDLHTANLVTDRDGRVRIIDWGCAARQCAAWDLALLGSGAVQPYLEARRKSAAFDEALFADQLRAAAAVRLSAAVDRLLAPTSAAADRHHRADAVRRCVRLAEESADR